jgi:hypothetical protein
MFNNLIDLFKTHISGYSVKDEKGTLTASFCKRKPQGVFKDPFREITLEYKTLEGKFTIYEKYQYGNSIWQTAKREKGLDRLPSMYFYTALSQMYKLKKQLIEKIPKEWQPVLSRN